MAVYIVFGPWHHDPDLCAPLIPRGPPEDHGGTLPQGPSPEILPGDPQGTPTPTRTPTPHPRMGPPGESHGTHREQHTLA